jgi:hypothetical protein
MWAYTPTMGDEAADTNAKSKKTNWSAKGVSLGGGFEAAAGAVGLCSNENHRCTTRQRNVPLAWNDSWTIEERTVSEDRRRV